MTSTANLTQSDPSDREKWDQEVLFRKKELALKEREQETRGDEVRLRLLAAHRQSGWRNPLVIAVIAAAVAASGNAVVTLVNGNLQRQIEDQKSEQARILEMIKTGNPDKAAQNLEFLLDAGLISNPDRIEKLRKFLMQRKPGSGPALAPATSNSLSTMTEAEKKNLIETTFLMADMLSDVLRLLTISQLHIDSPSEALELIRIISDVKVSRMMLHMRRSAALMRGAVMRIPTKSDLQTLKQEIEALEGSDPRSVIEISKRVLERLNEFVFGDN